MKITQGLRQYKMTDPDNLIGLLRMTLFGLWITILACPSLHFFFFPYFGLHLDPSFSTPSPCPDRTPPPCFTDEVVCFGVLGYILKLCETTQKKLNIKVKIYTLTTCESVYYTSTTVEIRAKSRKNMWPKHH